MSRANKRFVLITPKNIAVYEDTESLAIFELNGSEDLGPIEIEEMRVAEYSPLEAA